MTETFEEQIERLQKERDEWKAKAVRWEKELSEEDEFIICPNCGQVKAE